MSSRSSPEPSGSSTPPHFLDTVEGEIALFRGITQARPVGLHRHFHVLAILQSIKQETGQHVTAEDVWTKLRTLYSLEALEELVRWGARGALWFLRTDRFFLAPGGSRGGSPA